jgi:hypothetical protein
MVLLTEAERDLLVAALDSHAYWQLSDSHYRNDGAVIEPGSDDEETAQEITDAQTLQDRLSTLDF